MVLCVLRFYSVCFFKQKTAYERRISDWSSDVCSSDRKELLAEGISSQAQYDQAVLAVQTAKQSIQTARQQSESVRATLSGHVDAPAEQQPEVQRAQAALDRALLNLGYTRSEEHTSDLQSLMRISYAVFCLIKTYNTI